MILYVNPLCDEAGRDKLQVPVHIKSCRARARSPPAELLLSDFPFSRPSSFLYDLSHLHGIEPEMHVLVLGWMAIKPA